MTITLAQLIDHLQMTADLHGNDLPVLIRNTHNGSMRQVSLYVDEEADLSYTFPGPTPADPVAAVIL